MSMFNLIYICFASTMLLPSEAQYKNVYESHLQSRSKNASN